MSHSSSSSSSLILLCNNQPKIQDGDPNSSGDKYTFETPLDTFETRDDYDSDEYVRDDQDEENLICDFNFIYPLETGVSYDPTKTFDTMQSVSVSSNGWYRRAAAYRSSTFAIYTYANSDTQSSICNVITATTSYNGPEASRMKAAW